MKRTGFKRPQLERKRTVHTPVPEAHRRQVSMARADGMAQPVAKDVTARKGKRRPTKEEREWMDAIAELGCIACLVDGRERVPGAVHHILRGGHRIGHLYTICLCDPGHHQNGQINGLISRHPWKAQFETRYGTEAELLNLTKKKLEAKK